MKAFVEHIRKAYVTLIEKQGFPLVVTACICVITATALWTKPSAAPEAAPAPSAAMDISAAQLQQQSLRTMTTPTSLPTDPPKLYAPPLTAYSLLTPFNASVMQHSSVTGIWSIHDAADLQASPGIAVLAIADGTIITFGQDKLLGGWVRIDHGEGVEALYAGMAEVGSFGDGDCVHAGEKIGSVGNGPLAESDLPPHLHLRVTKDGSAVDPLSLWE